MLFSFDLAYGCYMADVCIQISVRLELKTIVTDALASAAYSNNFVLAQSQ